MCFGGKPSGKETTRKARRRWKDNIEMDVQEIGFGGVEWINLAKDRDS